MNVDNDGAPATFAPAFISKIVDAPLAKKSDSFFDTTRGQNETRELPHDDEILGSVST